MVHYVDCNRRLEARTSVLDDEAVGLIVVGVQSVAFAKRFYGGVYCLVDIVASQELYTC